MKHYSGHLTDHELMSGIRNGDGNVIQVVFRMYHALLCSTVFRIVQDREIAKDIVQDVFIRFWNKHESLPPDLELKAYLRRSAINGALNHLREIKRIPQGSLEDSEIIAEPQQIEHIFYANDLETAINLTIDRLPPVCRTVFMLSRFDEMSNSEIAGQLEISIKSVEKHITKALKSLRSAMAKQNN
jgi:RNA polymerase sigma-70 factor (ECF subfamily)